MKKISSHIQSGGSCLRAAATSRLYRLRHKLSARNLRILVAVCLLLIPVGCASVSVRRGNQSSVSEKPLKIYVQDFVSEGGIWNVDREGVELVDFKSKTQEMLTSDILLRVPKRLVPAEKNNNPLSLPPQNAWLITGRFTRVNQGSRLLRATIGFGSGGTKVETEVEVYDLSKGLLGQRPFLTFSTTGGSGAAQAGALFGGPIGAVPNAVGGSVAGLSDDIRRTSREITAALSDYMFIHGWVNEDQHVKAKYKK